MPLPERAEGDPGHVADHELIRAFYNLFEGLVPGEAEGLATLGADGILTEAQRPPAGTELISVPWYDGQYWDDASAFTIPFVTAGIEVNESDSITIDDATHRVVFAEAGFYTVTFIAESWSTPSTGAKALDFGVTGTALTAFGWLYGRQMYAVDDLEYVTHRTVPGKVAAGQTLGFTATPQVGIPSGGNMGLNQGALLIARLS